MEKLPGLHLVAQAHIQKALEVTVRLAEEVLKALSCRLDASDLRAQSENDACPQQELVANLVLAERNVRRPHGFVEDVKCVGTLPGRT